MLNDPNGQDWDDWKRQNIIRPCGCTFPSASSECACDVSCPHCWPDFQEIFQELDEEWPMPNPPPYLADDEGSTMTSEWRDITISIRINPDDVQTFGNELGHLLASSTFSVDAMIATISVNDTGEVNP